MTFTAKMILSGIALYLLMLGLTKLYEKDGDEPPFLVDLLGLIAIGDVILFSMIWIWSQ